MSTLTLHASLNDNKAACNLLCKFWILLQGSAFIEWIDKRNSLSGRKYMISHASGLFLVATLKIPRVMFRGVRVSLPCASSEIPPMYRITRTKILMDPSLKSQHFFQVSLHHFPWCSSGILFFFSWSFLGEEDKKGDTVSGKEKCSAFEINVFDKSELRADLNDWINSGVVCFQATSSRRVVQSCQMVNPYSCKCLVR